MIFINKKIWHPKDRHSYETFIFKCFIKQDCILYRYSCIHIDYGYIHIDYFEYDATNLLLMVDSY